MRGQRDSSMKYTTVGEVVAADQEQISFWWCSLRDPMTPDEELVMDLVFRKYYVKGRLGVSKRARAT